MYLLVSFLEALRTCNAILFVLNYASYKDNAISDLFKDITETKFRSESKIEKSGSLCKSDKSYTEQVPYQATIQVEDQRSFYEVDLRETTKLIKQKIDIQVSRSQEVLQRTIHKQVLDDFKNAEQQINRSITILKAFKMSLTAC